jgi:hypothetical protein
MPAFVLAAGLLLAGGCDGSGSGSERSGDGDEGDPEAFHYLCDVVFTVGGPASTYEEVGIAASFSKSLGTFLVDSRGASCRSDLATPFAGEQEGLNNSPSKPEEQTRRLFVTLDDVEGIGLPAETATCRFLARSEPFAEDFSMDASVWQPVGSSEEPNYWNRPAATVTVTGCTALPEPSESTTTTTTLDDCAVAGCAADELCVDGDCEAAETGRLEIYLDSAPEPVGAVQLQIDYKDSGAVFTHPLGKPACTPNPGVTGWLYADCDFRGKIGNGCDVIPGFHPGELMLGIATVQSFAAPLLLVSCDVASEDLEAAEAALRIESVQVSNADGDLIQGAISKRLVRD